MAKPPEKQASKEFRPEGSESADLAQEIAKRIGSLVPQGTKAQVVAQVVNLVSEERFSGPIAHPRHLREYEEICPGAADRIIGMAERNLQHAHDLQNRAMDGDIDDTKAGRLYGFLALMSLIVAASLATYLDHEIIAGAFLTAGALGVIGQLIQGKAAKPSEG